MILIAGHNGIIECSFPQEVHTFNTTNTRHNTKIMSSAFFGLTNPHKNSEGGGESGANIGYVSDDQMA